MSWNRESKLSVIQTIAEHQSKPAVLNPPDSLVDA